MTSLIKFGCCLVAKQYSPHLRPLITSGQFRVCNQIRSAGHAKWQNIKSTKQASDLAKGKLISRYVLLVRRAVVAGNMQTDPKLNTKLGDILSEASKLNVPKATLERAIVRATNVKIIQTNMEIQGPGGCTLIARCETDNIGLLRRDIKKQLKKHEANLMPDDSLINMFKSQGFVRTTTKTVDGRDIDGDFAEEAAIMSNAEEVNKESYEDAEDQNLAESWVFTTDANYLGACKGALEKQGFKVLSSEVELVPYREIDFGSDIYEKVVALQKALRELEQVVDVFHNVAIPKE